MIPGMARDFPDLQSQGYTLTSAETTKYNCIAWAAKDQSRWWWPDTRGVGYWPPTAPRLVTIDAFKVAYGLLDFVQCGDGVFEAGREKIAIYTLMGSPTHAARQIGPNEWTSKMGKGVDITHTLSGLNGPKYGWPTVFMQRPT